MRKGSKKRTTLALVLLFLIGAVMFIWPMVSEVTSYQADNEEYFKVEVFGHVIADGSINGDVICHGNMDCSDINSFGSVQVSGNLSANKIRLTGGKLSCGSIAECHEIRCPSIECTGDIHAANLINAPEE